MEGCRKRAQGRTCSLESLHDGCHVDKSGFRFIDESWPNHLGNGPNGYPMNNPAFDAAAKKVLESRKEDARHAEVFLRKLSQA